MAAAPVKPKPSGNPLTRKLGPLPAYAWLGMLVLAYFAYTHYKGSGSTAATTAANPLPLAGQAAADTSGGGGGTSIPTMPLQALSQTGDTAGVPTPAAIGPEQAAAVALGGAPGGLAQDGPASDPTPAAAIVAAAVPINPLAIGNEWNNPAYIGNPTSVASPAAGLVGSAGAGTTNTPLTGPGLIATYGPPDVVYQVPQPPVKIGVGGSKAAN